MIQNQAEDAMQLYEIYGLLHIPFWQRLWFIIITSVVCCGLLIIIACLLITKYRKNKKVLLDWQVALQHLESLKKNAMLTSAMSERYYVYLTGLLKEYMSTYYRHDLHSFTDEQMVAYIEQLPLYIQQKEQLTKIFSAGLFIKFAHQQAVEQQMLEDWQHAYDFIITTKNKDNTHI